MSYDKKKLAQYLGELIANTTSDADRVDRERPHSMLGGAGSHFEMTDQMGQTFVGRTSSEGTPTLYIMESGLRALNSFVYECLKDREFASKIGTDAIVGRLHTVAKELYTKSIDEIDLDVLVKEQVLKNLRAEIKTWRVQVPICNLRIHKQVTIGKVTFAPHEEGVLFNEQIVDERKLPNDADREAAEKAMLRDAFTKVAQQGNAWAIVQVEAHDGRVTEVAREHIEIAINVIRAFTHVFIPLSYRPGFGFPYELTNRMATFISRTSSDFKMETDRKGIFIEFDLTETVLSRLREEFCFDCLSKLAGSDWNTLNSLEQAVRVSFGWLGRSVIALTISEAFTLCVIALERLLIVDGEEATTERFAERLAFLLSEEAAMRKDIHRTAKRLYEIRSKIVHAGFDSVELYQLEEIEGYAVNGLAAVASLMNRFTDHSSLREHWHNCKMA